MMHEIKSKWPKIVPALTADQARIKEDFMQYWHEVLPRRYGMIERFNHGYPARASARRGRTLEIGAGLGEHFAYEKLDGDDYHALELRDHMAARIQGRFPSVHVSVGDCQKRTSYPDGYFDRVLAIHVLEHLPNLPAAISEVRRIIKPDGRFCVVIPCEGGLAYSIARSVSAKRIFEKRYGVSYDWFIRSEHINVPAEILSEIERCFSIKHTRYFPFLAPVVDLNLVIGMVLTPRPAPAGSNHQTDS